MNFIDTHVHIWNFNKAYYSWLKGDTSILNRSYLLEELEEQRLKTKVSHGILVQAANNFHDTEYMFEVAEKSDWIVGVVGWLPLMRPDVVDDMLVNNYLKNNYFKGIRHLIHNEKEANWLSKPEVIESLEILSNYNIPYDVVGVHTKHIETALKVAEKVPRLKMVFDHLNQPPINAPERFGRWGELMKTAAQHDKFEIKISGMGSTTSKGSAWTAEDIKPYLDFALENFGVKRCFCGGDWPVALLAGSYTQVWENYEVVLSDLLNQKDLEQVAFSNAVDFYNLNIIKQ